MFEVHAAHDLQSLSMKLTTLGHLNLRIERSPGDDIVGKREESVVLRIMCSCVSWSFCAGSKPLCIYRPILFPSGYEVSSAT
jgi:hypothetical protein